MGNCFCRKKKPEIISPYSVEERAREIRDMVRDLEKRGQRPVVTRGGLYFLIDYNEGNPSRLPSRQEATVSRLVQDMLDDNEASPELLDVLYQYVHDDDEEDDDDDDADADRLYHYVGDAADDKEDEDRIVIRLYIDNARTTPAAA